MVECSSGSWSSLPWQCLHLICTKLPDIADFVRFRSVCTSWRSCISPSEHFPRLPYLLINDHMYGEGHSLILYSFTSGKTYIIRYPGKQYCSLWGPGDGYVFCSRYGHDNSLLNPLTGKQIPLPPFEDGYGHDNSLLNPLTGEQIPLPPFEDGYWQPSRLIPNPSSNNNCIAVWSKNFPARILFLASCRPGDEQWAITHCPENVAGGTSTYFEGFHFIDRDLKTDTDTLIVDDTDGEVTSVVSSPEGCTSSRGIDYLVESDGQILKILYKCDDYNKNPVCFIIHQLDFDMERGCYQWIEINGIGDRMLFLEMVSGFSLRSSDFPGLPGNCIYFIDCLPGGVTLRRYNLEDSTLEVLPYPPGRWGSWILPSLC